METSSSNAAAKLRWNASLVLCSTRIPGIPAPASNTYGQDKDALSEASVCSSFCRRAWFVTVVKIPIVRTLKHALRRRLSPRHVYYTYIWTNYTTYYNLLRLQYHRLEDKSPKTFKFDSVCGQNGQFCTSWNRKFDAKAPLILHKRRWLSTTCTQIGEKKTLASIASINNRKGSG